MKHSQLVPGVRFSKDLVYKSCGEVVMEGG